VPNPKQATPTTSDLVAAVLTATEESVKQAQDLVDFTIGQARQFTDTVADATVATLKRNQQLTQLAIGSLSAAVSKGFDGSLSGLTRFDARETVVAGFGLAQTMIDAQRELAERLVGNVASPVAAA